MTAATPAFEQLAPETSAAERAALRTARIRGGVFAFFGLFAFYSAIGSFGTTATFSFWISEQGGEQLTLVDDRRPPVGPGRRRHRAPWPWASSSAAPGSRGAARC